MSDAEAAAASSTGVCADSLIERFVAKALLQLMIGINGLLFILLLGTGAVAYTITVNKHYETLGSFIDFLFLMAELSFAMELAILVALGLFIATQRNNRATLPR
jgi:hypothetical protein